MSSFEVIGDILGCSQSSPGVPVATASCWDSWWATAITAQWPGRRACHVSHLEPWLSQNTRACFLGHWIICVRLGTTWMKSSGRRYSCISSCMVFTKRYGGFCLECDGLGPDSLKVRKSKITHALESQETENFSFNPLVTAGCYTLHELFNSLLTKTLWGR